MSSGGALRMVPAVPPHRVIFGTTAGMTKVWQAIEKIAGANLPVLIHGESGTGKDVIARCLHRNSPWSNGPFVKINCPAIPGTLMESELFGYEKGAFTGASVAKLGRMEMANRGTLFLDEISELESGLQSKLLQVLQDGQFCRIGGQQDTKIDARVVCATNKSLEREIETGTFRQDLYYRIQVVSLHLPPLRDRAEDIPTLANYFLELYNEKYNCRTAPIPDALMAKMKQYAWPGNIRELENLVRRYVILGSEEAISAELSSGPRSTADLEIFINGPVSLKKITREAVRDLERKVILRVLEINNWNRKKAARYLSISYRALLYKIRDTGLVDVPE